MVLDYVQECPYLLFDIRQSRQALVSAIARLALEKVGAPHKKNWNELYLMAHFADLLLGLHQLLQVAQAFACTVIGGRGALRGDTRGSGLPFQVHRYIFGRMICTWLQQIGLQEMVVLLLRNVFVQPALFSS